MCSGLNWLYRIFLLNVYQVKIDWDRYVDEDEEEEGFDTSALDGGMGMGGMPPGMEVSSIFL